MKKVLGFVDVRLVRKKVRDETTSWVIWPSLLLFCQPQTVFKVSENFNSWIFCLKSDYVYYF